MNRITQSGRPELVMEYTVRILEAYLGGPHSVKPEQIPDVVEAVYTKVDSLLLEE
jgi:predicted transcriptional regulator